MTKATSQGDTGANNGDGNNDAGAGNGNNGDQNQNQNGNGNVATVTTTQTNDGKNQNNNSGNGDGKDNGGDQNGGTQNVDLTKLSGDQLIKVLENPEFFKTPRMKELLAASKELKTLKEKQQQDEEATLAEQKKFEELATKKAQEVETLKKQLQDTTVNQSLSNKLVGEKVIDLDGALKLIDRSKVSIDENGVVTGIEDAIADLKTGKPYLFKKAEDENTNQNNGNQNNNSGNGKTVGAASNTQNGNNQGGKISFKRSEIAAMTPAEYQQNRTDILKAQREGRIENDM